MISRGLVVLQQKVASSVRKLTTIRFTDANCHIAGKEHDSSADQSTAEKEEPGWHIKRSSVDARSPPSKGGFVGISSLLKAT
jgi:hypothetical protein